MATRVQDELKCECGSGEEAIYEAINGDYVCVHCYSGVQEYLYEMSREE